MAVPPSGAPATARPAGANSVPRRVAILVYDGVTLLDVAGPAEAFKEANRFGADTGSCCCRRRVRTSRRTSGSGSPSMAPFLLSAQFVDVRTAALPADARRTLCRTAERAVAGTLAADHRPPCSPHRNGDSNRKSAPRYCPSGRFIAHTYSWRRRWRRSIRSAAAA
jgi:hypothetical protein